MAKEEVKKLHQILQRSEQDMATLEGGQGSVPEVLGRVKEGLQELKALASRLGIKALVRIGTELERYASQTSLSPEDLTTITYALGTLRGGLAEGRLEALRSAMMETLELLGVEPLDVMTVQRAKEPLKKKSAESSFPMEHIETKPQKQENPPEKAPEVVPEPKVDEVIHVAVEEKQESSNMTRIASQLGGRLVFSGKEGDDSFKLELPSCSLQKVMFLLSPADAGEAFASSIPTEDDRLKNVINGIKDFMASFADGNLEKAQEILEDLAGSQGEGEIYKEIGGLARELHNLMENLASTLTQDLKEIVEDQMPDSGNRLEHILQLTEEAATTTLDHAEAIQNRIQNDRKKLERIEKHFAMLKPIGDSANARMDESCRLIQELKGSLSQNNDDLSTILTSQGYQDLTGQVITKIVDFQKGLEAKLINIVQSFGAKANKSKVDKKKQDKLYGPAHEKVEGAARSQDEVDDILAQFGF